VEAEDWKPVSNLEQEWQTVVSNALRAIVRKLGGGLRLLFGALVLVVLGLALFEDLLASLVLAVLTPFLFVWQLLVAGWLPHALILGIIWYVAYLKWGRE